MIHIFSRKLPSSRPSLALVVLFVFTLLLTFVVIFSEPRIRSTILDESLLRQTYTMQLNTAVQPEIDSFSISPDIKTDISVSKNSVTVLFTEPLRYNQEYTISYSVLTTEDSLVAMTSSFSTTTPDGYYLTRKIDEKDSIRKFSTENSSEPEIVYESDEIITYALSKTTFGVLENVDDSQQLFIIDNGTKNEVIFPANKKAEELHGSSTKDSYIMLLVDQTSYTSSLWEYSVTSNALVELVDEQGDAIKASDITYAPDGESIAYQDENRVLIMRNFNTTQSALTFGKFDNIRRFLPNEKALFGYRNNKPIAVKASDGSFIEPPEQVELSYQALLMQDLESYAYFTQTFDSDKGELEQRVISLNDQGEKVLYTASIEDSLLMSLDSSPNDQYLLIEAAPRPTIYDDRAPNAKPENAATTIYSRVTGTEVKKIDGFDIQWR
jgi:hypothetical protein